MTEEKIETKIEKAVAEAQSQQKFDFEIDKRIEGALFLRVDGKAEFFPKAKRDGKGGMTTTNKTDTFTIQESTNKVKITLSLDKAEISFNKVLKHVSKLVQTLQNMKIV